MPTRLLEAAQKGILFDVVNCLKKGIDINTADEEGRTALHLAAEHNHLYVAWYLIHNGANVNALMLDDGTPIFDAVAMGHYNMVVFLLENRANPYLQDKNGWSLLHWAVEMGHLPMARLLMNYYSRLVDVVAEDVRLPVMLAMQRQDLSMLSLFGQLLPRLTQIELDQRIKTIYQKVTLNEHYYGITGRISQKELNLTKWKTYMYLRTCVLAYQRGFPDELLQLLHFLETPKQPSERVSNKEWLKQKILDRNKAEAGEIWQSGSHEWLLRSLIVDVLKRSAGMIAEVESETTCINGINVDWLYVQAFLRSPTKYLFFKLPSNSIAEGHKGAVRGPEGTFKSTGSPGFHAALAGAFQESHHISSFITRARTIFINQTISGKKFLSADSERRTLVDGTETTDATKIDLFRAQLKEKGYFLTNGLMKNMTLFTRMPSEVYSASPVDSDSDDDEKYALVRKH